MASTIDRSEIAFFDLETTFPIRPGQVFAILEFGSILVCPSKLVELESYETLVQPHDLSLISTLTDRGNGITANAVLSAPTFSDIADKVYDILHGRIWAGHNIIEFDCVRLRDAFAQINRPPPEPKGLIDSWALLTHTFGRRAGDMKLASLANHFGLGKQLHRSLADARMNFEVLKSCATVLFLESSLPDIFTENSWVSIRSNTITEPLEANEAMEEEPPIAVASNTITDSAEFLDLNHVSLRSITVTFSPFFCGFQKMQVLHKNAPLRIRCDGLNVRFGLSTKFVDHAGRPRLSFVVDASPNLCRVLDAYDDIAMRFVDSDSRLEWTPVVIRQPGFCKPPTVRLRLDIVGVGNGVRWITEIYQKESSASASTQRIVFSRYDVAELEALIRPGSLVDAFICLDPYDYQQNAGFRLVAKKLIVDSK